MTELQRLLDGSSDELALALLRSAGDDSPSTDSLKAAAVVLGIGTGLGGSVLLVSGLRTAAGPGAGVAGGGVSQAAIAAAPVTTAGAALTLGAIAKQVAIGLATGLFAMGGLELALDGPFASNAPAPVQEKVSISPARTTPELRPQGQPIVLSGPMVASVAAEPAKASAPSSAKDGAVPAARRRTVASGAAAAVGVPAAVALPEAAVEPTAVEVEPAPDSAKPQPAVALNKSLAVEVALLDRARSALLSQNASGALSALAQYRKERQTGILDPEATVLEIQVLEKLGDHAAAVRLARHFISSHPASRHVDSLRVLAAEAP